VTVENLYPSSKGYFLSLSHSQNIASALTVKLNKRSANKNNLFNFQEPDNDENHKNVFK
jgi:hypothetical protein